MAVIAGPPLTATKEGFYRKLILKDLGVSLLIKGVGKKGNLPRLRNEVKPVSQRDGENLKKLWTFAKKDRQGGSLFLTYP